MRPLRIPVCPSPGNCPGFYLPANLPSDHPQARQLIPCACTLASQAKTIKAELAPSLRAMTFETFRPEEALGTTGNRTAFERAQQFAADPWGQGWYWLVLIGANGRGKTHLAAAVVNALLARGEPSYFENVSELLDYLRAGYSVQSGEDFERRMTRVKDAPVLALDDLGAEAGQNAAFEVSWAQDKVYQILDHRLVEQLPAIVTTNLPLDKLPQRIASRLQDRRAARVIAITTGDKRTLCTREKI
jgi:DNA replication protein DnaC